MRSLIDGHLDLAWNAASHDRDLRLTVDELNASESNMSDVGYRGRATTTFPELQLGRVAVCLGTLLARSGPAHHRAGAYRRVDLDFATRIGSHAAAHAQLACYELWQRQGAVRLLTCATELDEHWLQWQSGQTQTLGVILTMEGADPITSPDELDHWYARGLRAIGPAHYGHSQYAGGTAVDGPLTDDGRALLGRMEQLGMGLDVTHLCDRSMAEAFDRFGGTVWASHHNCRAIVPGDRQLTDEQIRMIVARDGVIGAACDAWMLEPGWVIGRTLPEKTTLATVADHIDHVCQLAGSSRNAAIGSDLDGGFGTEQTPADLKRISDLQKLDGILQERGYSDDDVENIFSANWLRVFRQVLTSGDS